jgi:flagellar basal body-associated protein FliL
MDKQEFSELQKKFAKETRKRKYTKAFNYITTFLSVLGSSVLAYYFASSIFPKNTFDQEKIQKENIELTKKVTDLQNRLVVVDTSITIQRPNEERIIELEKKIETLNNIIIENPEKSLTIPLMKKDIENIRKGNDLQIELIKDKVETVIDLNKWILGLIFSLLITIVISNLSKSKLKNDE